MKNYDKPILECYTRLFAESTPPADFQQLMDDAELNELGQKVIPFDDHVLIQDRMDEIIQEVCKKYKFKPYEKRKFKTTIYLGCSPRSTPKPKNDE